MMQAERCVELAEKFDELELKQDEFQEEVRATFE